MRLFRKISRTYRQFGFFGGVRRAVQGIDRNTIHDVFNVYYMDLGARFASEPDRDDLSIRTVNDVADLQPGELERIDLYNDRDKLVAKLKTRFESKAVLWVVSSNGNVVMYVWSIRGRHLKPYFFPLTENDVLAFDGETFPEYRGKRLLPYALNRMAEEIRKQGALRLFTDTGIWNDAANRSLGKTDFKYFGTARLIRLPGKNITIWSSRNEIPSLFAAGRT